MMGLAQDDTLFAERIVTTCASKEPGATVVIAHVSPEHAERVIVKARKLAAELGVRIDHVTLKPHKFGGA